MKIALGSDHGGYALKCDIIQLLEKLGHEYKDFGCYSTESCDYPDFGEAAARAVASGEYDRGIVICTTGIGISIAANKVQGIRCAHRRQDDEHQQHCQRDLPLGGPAPVAPVALGASHVRHLFSRRLPLPVRAGWR